MLTHTAARRAQNAVLLYISKALSKSLPSSLSDVVKRIDTKKLTLPKEIEEAISGYWKHHGKKLKAYRDLSQHHALVASEVVIFRSSDGDPAIHLTLPNNPEAKNPSKLKFDDPMIDAFAYMHKELQWLILFCHKVTTPLIKPLGKSRAVSSTIVFRKPIEIGPGAKLMGHKILTAENVRSSLDKFLTTKLERL